jgi:hypothetical protein
MRSPFEHALGDRFAVDERAALGSAISEREPVALSLDFRVIARDVGAVQVQIVTAAAPDDEQVLLDRNGPRAEHISDVESGAGHAEDFGAHFFRSASQLTTTVIGAGVGCSTCVAAKPSIRATGRIARAQAPTRFEQRLYLAQWCAPSVDRAAIS